MEDGFLAAGDMIDMCSDLFGHIEDFLEFPNDEDLIAAVDHCPPPPTLPLQHQHHMPPPSASSSSSSSSQIMMMIPTPVAPAPPLATTATTMHDIIFLGDSSITATAPEHDDLDIAQLEWLSNFFDDSSSDPFSQDLANNDMNKNMNMNMNMNMSMSMSMSMNDNSKSDENGFNGVIRSGKDALFRACGSPVSVLEPNSLVGLSNNCSAKTTTSSSSSSSSGVGSSSNERLPAPPHSPPEAMVSIIPARARTKRPRAVSSPRPLIYVSLTPPPPPPPSAAAAVSEAEAESFGESDSSPSMATMPVPVMMMMQKKKKKQQQQQQQKKTKKRKSPGAAAIVAGEEEGGEAEGEDEGAGSPSVRKCMHCEIQKTPQWRAGPMGPKTLCNACGVRYKSGRLFPEYRPAASPTFIPTLHSNSHKKVVEMRIKASQKTSTVADKESPALKNCDLIEYIRRRD